MWKRNIGSVMPSTPSIHTLKMDHLAAGTISSTTEVSPRKAKYSEVMMLYITSIAMNVILFNKFMIRSCLLSAGLHTPSLDSLLVSYLLILWDGYFIHHASRQLCIAIFSCRPLSGSASIISTASQQQAIGQVRMEPSRRLGQASEGSLGPL